MSLILNELVFCLTKCGNPNHRLCPHDVTQGIKGICAKINFVTSNFSINN